MSLCKSKLKTEKKNHEVKIDVACFLRLEMVYLSTIILTDKLKTYLKQHHKV